MEFIHICMNENILKTGVSQEPKIQILKSIGKGGMGEVFLAHDLICGRNVALKQMRPQWAENPTMQERFLREARIASQLSHPSIIPIYTIDEKGTYYTMPYIEGETLKEIIRKTKELSKKGVPMDSIGSSIPALLRIFLSVCGAIAYAHSQGVLHRDLKPENIIVGKYSEVIILDWGLADFIDAPEKNGLDFPGENPHLTQPGKIPGTLLYMAPERAFGARSSLSCDIYSLGVTLYQILTLRLPFQRASLKEFRKMSHLEELLDPEEVAPDREISPQLSQIVKKCLEKDPAERYSSVDELIKDLENYIEGLPQWMDAAELTLERKEDWQFQENVALTKHRALTRNIEMLEWVNLMVSQSHFPGNLKIEADLTLHEKSQGLGIVFCIPENQFPKGLEEAYCLWLTDSGLRFFRSSVEVLQKEIPIEKNTSHHLLIEKVDNHIRFFLDGVQVFSFLSHIPLPGDRIGLLLRDGNFSLSKLKVCMGSQNILVNCLAIPDAFLVRKNYDAALEEYRKISHSFPGRAEGREATFRAGLTLLKQEKFSEALDEFEKLHHTPGAPLEYLGKSLVYKALSEIEEEIKCLELVLRKFPSHPLRSILVENILSRLHETSQNQREEAYRFALLTLRHLSHLPDTQRIFAILESHLESLPFFTPSENRETHLTIQLAFWLNQPLVLTELLERGLNPVETQNANVALFQLGQEDLVQGKIPTIPSVLFDKALKTGKMETLQEDLLDDSLKLWRALLLSHWEEAKKLVEKLTPKTLVDEKHINFFLYGCCLAKEHGEKKAFEHLTNISEKAYPPIPSLLSHYIMGRIHMKGGWIEKAFFWEKEKLSQQLDLYFHCLGKKKCF